MSSGIINEDLRSVKTKNALYTAMLALLRKNNFKKITIKGICEEAQISRAAFYAHFIDKYDLLEHLTEKLLPKSINCHMPYEQIEKSINSHIRENMLILENLICDADDETLGILFNYILSTVNYSIRRNGNGAEYSANIVRANFYAGGFISYLNWMVKNKFPSNVPPMNKALFETVREFQEKQLNRT